MKKTFLPKISVLGLLFAGIFLFGSAGNLVAQVNTTNDLYSQPKGPFVTAADAIQILNDEMIELKELMGGLNSSTNQYKVANLKYVYYEHMVRLLTNEKATSSDHVGKAIARGLGIYASDVYGNISEQQKLANREGAIALLRT